MKRKEVYALDSSAVSILDIDGDEVWIYEAHGHVGIGVAPGADADALGLAVLLDAGKLACVIAALSVRLAAMLDEQSTAYTRAADGPPVPATNPRPVAGMSRAEIRSELVTIWRGAGMSTFEIDDLTAAIERGATLMPDSPARVLELARAYDGAA